MDTEPTPPETLGSRLPAFWSWPLALIAVLLVTATGWRIAREYSVQQREFDWENRALSDLHNGLYYPTLAFRHGLSPYSQKAVEEYQLSRPSPPYSPFLFMLHWPLTWMPVVWADVVFSIINLAMLLGLAAMGVRYSSPRFDWPIFWLVTDMLLVSRPGHITLFTGYFTLEFILGTLLALHYSRSRPWVSAIGILLASGKPTYFLPLVILMLARRDFKPVVRGIALSIVAVGIGVGWLTRYQSPAALIEECRETQTVHQTDASEFPVNSWTRVDILGMVAKVQNWVPSDVVYLGSVMLFLAMPVVVIWRWRPREAFHGATGLTGWIAILSMLLSIYHHSYDCLVLVVPWVGLTFYGPRVVPEVSGRVRWLVAVLTAVPAANYLSTISFRNLMGWDSDDFIWQAITMVNAVCLTTALVMILIAAARHFRQEQTENDAGAQTTRTV